MLAGVRMDRNTSCNLTSTNSTDDPISSPWYSNAYNVTLVVLYAVIIVAALAGNILVCLAVCINANLRQNVASYFIVSLALSDIGTASFSMTFDLELFTTNFRWHHGEVLCVVWTTAYLITVPSSIWNLFVLSIDRYKTLKNPWNRFKESHSMTSRRAGITIIVLWIYCFVFALLPVMGWKNYPQSVTNNYCNFNISMAFSNVGSLVNFYLPMFAMCWVYYKVYRIAHAHNKIPLKLEVRFDTGSGIASRASTFFASESITRPPIDKQHSLGSVNKKNTNKGTFNVGLENVSFDIEDENTKRNSIKDEAICEENQQQAINVELGKSQKHGTDNVEELDLDTAKDAEEHEIQCYDYLNTTIVRDLQIEKANALHRKIKSESKMEIENNTAQMSSEGIMTSKEEISILGEERKNVYSSEETGEGSAKDMSFGRVHYKSTSGEILYLNDNIQDRATNGNARDKTTYTDEQYPGSVKLNTPLSYKNHLKLNALKLSFPANHNETRSAKFKPGIKNTYGSYHNKKKKNLNKSSQDTSENDICRLRRYRRTSSSDLSNACTNTSALPAMDTQRALNNTTDSLNYSNKKRLKHFSKNTKAARTISVIVGAFLVCWVPFTTMSIVFNFCGKPCYTLIPPQVFHVLLLLGYANSAINPILFSYKNMQFRKSYRRMARMFIPCLKRE